MGEEVRHARDLVVRGRAAKLVFCDFLVRDRFDDIRSSDKHVRAFVDHEDEVGDRRRIHGTAGTWAHHRRDLWNHSAGQCVAKKDVSIARQRHHSFLNARAAGIVKSDHRSANSHGHIHDLHDLRRIRFR